MLVPTISNDIHSIFRVKSELHDVMHIENDFTEEDQERVSLNCRFVYVVCIDVFKTSRTACCFSGRWQILRNSLHDAVVWITALSNLLTDNTYTNCS